MKSISTNGTCGIESYSALSGLRRGLLDLTRGDALRFATRLPLAFIFRALGAQSLSFETVASAGGIRENLGF